MLLVACALVVVLTYVFRWSLLHTRTFDPDEFQHLHAAWVIHQGALPFRDYFEHHMPALPYMLALGLDRLHVETVAGDAERFAILARELMWLFAGMSVVMTVVIGQLAGDLLQHLKAMRMNAVVIGEEDAHGSDFVSRTLFLIWPR